MPRKNVRGKTGVRFKTGYTTAKNNSMLRNVVTELFVYGKVEVTEKTATELRPLAEKMVTLAKKGDLSARRQAAKVIRNVYVDKEETQTALQKLFSEIATKYQDRQGGYTRIIKLDNRKGDNSPMALVELV